MIEVLTEDMTTEDWRRMDRTYREGALSLACLTRPGDRPDPSLDQSVEHMFMIAWELALTLADGYRAQCRAGLIEPFDDHPDRAFVDDPSDPLADCHGYRDRDPGPDLGPDGRRTRAGWVRVGRHLRTAQHAFLTISAAFQQHEAPASVYMAWAAFESRILGLEDRLRQRARIEHPEWAGVDEAFDNVEEIESLAGFDDDPDDEET